MYVYPLLVSLCFCVCVVHNDISVLKRNIIGMVAGHPTRRLNMNDLNTLYESAHKESLYSHLPPGHSLESFISTLCSPELEVRIQL